MSVRRRIINIAVLVTTLGSCLIVGEFVLRITDFLSGGPPAVPPPAPYRIVTPQGSRLIPETDVVFLFEGTTRPVRVRINTQGFRGCDLQAAHVTRRLRILILGDSVTFGYGVEEDSTFVGELERLLAEEPCFEDSCLVVNGGIEDVGVHEERLVLEEKGDRLNPDIVLIGFYPNDSRPPVGFHQEYLVEDPIDRWVRTHPSLTFRSRLVSFLHYRYRRLLMALHLYRSPLLARFAWVDLWREGRWKTEPDVLDSLVDLARFDWGAAWLPESWESVSHELKLIKRWCGVRDIAMGVFYLPVDVQIEGSRELRYPSEMLGRVCSTLDIPFHDTVPILEGCISCFMDQCHLTPEGHRRIAEELRAWLCWVFAAKWHAGGNNESDDIARLGQWQTKDAHST